jgi:hypothetical protein
MGSWKESNRFALGGRGEIGPQAQGCDCPFCWGKRYLKNAKLPVAERHKQVSLGPSKRIEIFVVLMSYAPVQFPGYSDNCCWLSRLGLEPTEGNGVDYYGSRISVPRVLKNRNEV